MVVQNSSHDLLMGRETILSITPRATSRGRQYEKLRPVLHQGETILSTAFDAILSTNANATCDAESLGQY